jgi:hypothetical protein
MSPAFIKGVSEHFPNAQVTFDKFHVIAHASAAIDETRRFEQKIDPSIKGLRWALLKDRRAVRGGYQRFRTIRTVIFLIARKLDFSKLNPHIAQPT